MQGKACRGDITGDLQGIYPEHGDNLQSLTDRENITNQGNQVKIMVVLHHQQKAVPTAVAGLPDRSPGSSIHMLGFELGKDRYGIDLKEAMDVIRDLMMIQACTTRSMTERFVKFNRRHTFVFNLDECLRIHNGAGKTTSPSFLLLDEKIQDFCVGILVPGIPSIQKREFTAAGSRKNSRARTGTPLRGIVRGKTPGLRARSAPVQIIDLRELVENCIVHIRYMDSLQQTGN
jgi:chemotaxis signal transduction protein